MKDPDSEKTWVGPGTLPCNGPPKASSGGHPEKGVHLLKGLCMHRIPGTIKEDLRKNVSCPNARVKKDVSEWGSEEGETQVSEYIWEMAKECLSCQPWPD